MTITYRVTGRLTAKKLVRDFEDAYDMKSFIEDWAKHGITSFRIETIEAKINSEAKDK